MSVKKSLRPTLLVVLTLAACFSAQTVLASTVIVGTCKTGIQFGTINAAVAAAPAGATIDICPGTYPEQVTITKNLILKGISSGNAGAAIIVPPSGGLVQNATRLSGAGVEAQIYVLGPSVTVNISDLTFDAAGSNLDSLGCDGDPAGIFYKFASGTITRNSVLNDILSPNFNGCGGGLGIYAVSNSASDVLKITYNHVETYSKNGITVNGPGGAPGPSGTISNNTVIGQGPTTGAAENSIQVGFGATGTISTNTVGSDVWAPDTISDPGDAAAGILVYASSGVFISNNNVNNTQYGIVAVTDTSYGTADNTTVTKNTVSATHIFDGIDLCSNNNSATANLVNGSDEAGIHVDATCTGAATGNTVQKNVINSACAGVLSGSASGNTLSPNTYYNTVNLQLTGVDICQPPPVHGGKKSQARKHAQFNPARP